MSKLVVRSNSVDRTESIGGAIALHLCPGDIVELRGEMGSGKTALCRGIAKGFGVTGRVTSPTFITVREYRSPRGALIHCDLFRVSDPHYLEEYDVLEALDKGAVVLIEWPENCEIPAEANSLKLTLEQGEESGSRMVSFTGTGRWSRLNEELVTSLGG